MTEEQKQDEYTTNLWAAFAKVLKAEKQEKAAADFKKEQNAAIKKKETEAAEALQKAWDEVEAVMKEAGVVEELIPGAANDFKISYPKATKSVDVPDVEAVPDDFVKTEKKAKLKEIGDHMKALEADEKPLPNWCQWKESTPKIKYAPVKKK